VVQAVDGVSFEVRAGETLGIVGESGCGKSTTARLLMHLVRLDSGRIVFEGNELGKKRGFSRRDLHRQMQMVFQDSYASLNPRLPVARSIAFGPLAHGMAKRAARARANGSAPGSRLDPLLFADAIRMSCRAASAARINVARALALEPRLVILDEAVSA
jgi:peptide/nickel transport system ATP-binding protein